MDRLIRRLEQERYNSYVEDVDTGENQGADCRLLADKVRTRGDLVRFLPMHTMRLMSTTDLNCSTTARKLLAKPLYSTRRQRCKETSIACSVIEVGVLVESVYFLLCTCSESVEYHILIQATGAFSGSFLCRNAHVTAGPGTFYADW